MYDEYEESSFSQVGRSGRWHDARTPLTGSAQGVFWFIHVEDAASATVAAVSTGESGVYNIVDDEPAPVADWLPLYAEVFLTTLGTFVAHNRL